MNFFDCFLEEGLRTKICWGRGRLPIKHPPPPSLYFFFTVSLKLNLQDTPGVYADVAFYRYWLDSEMTGASFCPP